MRKIREVTLDEIVEAARVIQIAGADAERSLFLATDHSRAARLSSLRENFHAYIRELIEIHTGIGDKEGEADLTLVKQPGIAEPFKALSFGPGSTPGVTKGNEATAGEIKTE